MNDVLQLVQQLLRTANTERRDKHRPVVGQRALDRFLQAQPPIRATRVISIAVGAFEHDDIGPIGRPGRWQERGMRSPQITRENHALAATAVLVVCIHLHVRRAEDMAGALQPDPNPQRRVVT